jgi:hypothetical protein
MKVKLQINPSQHYDNRRYQWTVNEAVTSVTAYEDMLTYVATRMLLTESKFVGIRSV